MRKSITMKAGAVGTAFALAGGLAIIASGTTGAYFSDTNNGAITGTIGNIQVSTTGGAVTEGDGINFKFTNMMPGEPQTATVTYTNTGSMAQDVYLTFPNVPALHALNNLGSYGEVKVVRGPNTILFQSKNLQDGRHQLLPSGTNPGSTTTNTCGGFSALGCWPLLPKYLVEANVPRGGSGTVSFSFNYPTKMGGTGAKPDGSVGVFNAYPLTGLDIFAAPAGDADGAGAASSGLPFNVVAVQVDQQP